MNCIFSCITQIKRPALQNRIKCTFSVDNGYLQAYWLLSTGGFSSGQYTYRAVLLCRVVKNLSFLLRFGFINKWIKKEATYFHQLSWTRKTVKQWEAPHGTTERWLPYYSWGIYLNRSSEELIRAANSHHWKCDPAARIFFVTCKQWRWLERLDMWSAQTVTYLSMVWGKETQGRLQK